MSVTYQVERNGKVFGPYSSTRLAHLAKNGRLRGDDVVTQLETGKSANAAALPNFRSRPVEQAPVPAEQEVESTRKPRWKIAGGIVALTLGTLGQFANVIVFWSLGVHQYDTRYRSVAIYNSGTTVQLTNSSFVNLPREEPIQMMSPTGFRVFLGAVLLAAFALIVVLGWFCSRCGVFGRVLYMLFCGIIFGWAVIKGWEGISEGAGWKTVRSRKVRRRSPSNPVENDGSASDFLRDLGSG